MSPGTIRVHTTVLCNILTEPSLSGPDASTELTPGLSLSGPDASTELTPGLTLSGPDASTELTPGLSLSGPDALWVCGYQHTKTQS